MSEHEYPFITIIFPTWNGKYDSLECLNSLRKLKYPKERLEIIVSDNGSIDGSQHSIKQMFSVMKEDGWSGLKLIENKKNLGASIARNKAFKAANEKYTYIWTIDNDIVVEKNALKELMIVLENYKNIGIVGALIYTYDKPLKLGACGSIVNWKLLTFIDFNLKNLNSSKIYEVDAVSGSSLLIKRETIERIGLFDPDFFCYYNDTDLCARAKKANYKICISTNSIIWHKGSSSTKNVRGFDIYHKSRSLILFMKKNCLSKTVFFLFILYYVIQNTFKLIFRNDIYKISYLFRGLKDGMTKKEIS